MGDHPNEDVDIHQLANGEGDARPWSSGGIQNHSSIKLKLKLHPKAEHNLDKDPCSVSPLKYAAGASNAQDSGPQQLPLKGRKRKTTEWESTTCEDCGKSFPSLKSKYGHMRCHRDRVPRRKRRQYSELWTWSVTGKRCKSPTLYDEVHIAAGILMHLSRDNSHFIGDTLNNIGFYRDDGGDSKIAMVSKEAEDVGMSHKSASSRMYQCGICKKFFSTHQALGGHTASHRRKYNGEIGKMVVEGNGPDLSNSEILISSSYRVNKKAAVDHTCNVCGLAFSSGQALGGHKRLHWTRQNSHTLSTTSNWQTDSSVESNETSVRCGAELDLKEKQLDEGWTS